MEIEDLVVPAVMVGCLILLGLGIRGSLRRDATDAQRYSAASPEERRILDAKVEAVDAPAKPIRFGCGFACGSVLLLVISSWWLDSNEYVITGIAVMGGLVFGSFAARYGDELWAYLANWVFRGW